MSLNGAKRLSALPAPSPSSPHRRIQYRLPAGTPVAIRVMRTGKLRNAVASQSAVSFAFKRGTGGENHFVHFASFRATY